ncbi:MAG: D-alanyl-D-alanine carboxypeptidase [Actinobacteria bacterium HGW-Actinobacteria-10]|nr:MAG: D-alanyl-D-alanine carboxypeptidase [Actinobacteria bacterium HGW-Actinobacteria-10]
MKLIHFSFARILLVLITTVSVLHGPGTSIAVRQPTDVLGDWPVSQVPVELAAVMPDVSLSSGIVVTTDGRELWSRSAGQRRAMASTTKIMTAVVALENASLDETCTVTGEAAGIGESEAGVRTGDCLTIRALLEGTLVSSGNDAAQALAIYIGGSEAGFTRMMNEKAAALGLADTHFANAHGLDAPGHYTTARDLAILARYAMANQEFRRIVGMPTVDMDGPGGAQEIETSNELIGSYAGATGIKTGWTNDAGYSLVASARRNHMELVVVVLGARSRSARFDQARTLLDWGFEHYAPRKLASAEETLGVVPVTDYLDVTVSAITSGSVTVPVFDADGEIIRELSLESGIRAPVKRGDRVGSLTWRQGDRLLARVDVIAADDVAVPGFFERVWIAVRRMWRSATDG